MNINLVNNIVQDNSPLMVRVDMHKEEKELSNDVLPVVGRMPTGKSFSQTMVSNAGAIIEDTKSIEMQLQEKALVAKENLTNLINKLTTTDVKELDNMGLDSINDKDVDKVINVVEEIKIMLATYCEDYIPTGDIDIDAIKEFTGNAGLAAKVIKKLSQNNMPVTQDNVTDITNAVNEYKAIDGVDESAKRYLVKNGMEPTIDNLYKAKYSNISLGMQGNAVTDAQFSEMLGQVKDIIEKAGFDVNETTLENAKLILQEGAALTKESLELADSIDKIGFGNEDEIIDKIINTIVEGKTGKEAKLVDEISKKDKAIENSTILMGASIEDVLRIINNNAELNIENIASVKGDATYIPENEIKYKEGFISVEKARLVLSAGTLFTMEKLGIDTTKTSLNEMISMYESMDEANAAFVAVKEIENAPVNTLGEFLKTNTYTAAEFIETSYDVKWKLAKANEAYDTFATQIRGDLGDNLTRAVEASAKSMLMDMNLGGSYEEIMAVKILSYNGIDITEANVEKIATDYSTITNIITNISPKMVFDMIKRGENPLKTDINELSKKVDDYNEENPDRENFAKFLYKLERNHEIDDSQRADYIGLYKVFEAVKKEEAKSLGAIMKGDMELTLNNMITSYVSRKHSKMDTSIGENVSFTVGDGNLAFYKTIFEECENVANEDVPDEYYEEYLEKVKTAVYTEESIIRILTDNDEPVTINNLLAAMDYKNNKLYKELERLEDKDIKESLEEVFSDADTEDDLQANIEALKEKVCGYCNKSLNSDEINYEKYMATKDMLRNVNLLTNLSKKHEYNIPVFSKGNIVNVNLKLNKEEKGAGRVTIAFEDSEYGKVNISCKVINGKIDVLALGDNEESVRVLEDTSEGIKEMLADMELTTGSYNIGKFENEVNWQNMAVGGEKMDTAKLYSVAKIFISQIITK